MLILQHCIKSGPHLFCMFDLVFTRLYCRNKTELFSHNIIRKPLSTLHRPVRPYSPGKSDSWIITQTEITRLSRPRCVEHLNAIICVLTHRLWAWKLPPLQLWQELLAFENSIYQVKRLPITFLQCERDKITDEPDKVRRVSDILDNNGTSAF